MMALQMCSIIKLNLQKERKTELITQAREGTIRTPFKKYLDKQQSDKVDTILRIQEGKGSCTLNYFQKEM